MILTRRGLLAGLIGTILGKKIAPSIILPRPVQIVVPELWEPVETELICNGGQLTLADIVSAQLELVRPRLQELFEHDQSIQKLIGNSRAINAGKYRIAKC